MLYIFYPVWLSNKLQKLTILSYCKETILDIIQARGKLPWPKQHNLLSNNLLSQFVSTSDSVLHFVTRQLMLGTLRVYFICRRALAAHNLSFQSSLHNFSSAANSHASGDFCAHQGIA